LIEASRDLPKGSVAAGFFYCRALVSDYFPNRLPEVSEMSIESWREEIDRIDSELLRLLNMRARIAIKVAALKKAAALPLNDKDREQEVLEHVRQANTGPLDELDVGRVFRRIIRESRRAQTRFLQEDAQVLAHEVIR
jgi:chorismate mutase